jgi:uncharacterized protein involved in exopolysaccharide biosynthesis
LLLDSGYKSITSLGQIMNETGYKIRENDEVRLNKTPDQIDIINLIAIIWRGRFKILYITGGLMILGILYAILSANWYQASVKIMPTSTTKSNVIKQLTGLNIADLGVIPKYSEDRQLLYPDIVRSDFILDRVLRHRFRLDSDNYQTLFEFWGITVDSSQIEEKHRLFEEAKKDLREDYIEVQLDEETGIIIISLNVPSRPVLAAELANYITTQLEIYNKQFRRYKATDQRNFIENSIKETKIDLEVAEEALKTFNEENKDLSSPDTQLQYQRLLTEVEVQKSIYVELRKQLELAKIEEVKETETLDILQSAVVPIEKYKPRRLLIILFSFFLGIFISVIYIFIDRFWYENKNDFKEQYNNL